MRNNLHYFYNYIQHTHLYCMIKFPTDMTFPCTTVVTYINWSDSFTIKGYALSQVDDWWTCFSKWINRIWYCSIIVWDSIRIKLHKQTKIYSKISGRHWILLTTLRVAKHVTACTTNCKTTTTITMIQSICTRVVICI